MARSRLPIGRSYGVMRNGKPEAVTVQLGLSDGIYTSVAADDLQPGDELVLGG